MFNRIFRCFALLTGLVLAAAACSDDGSAGADQEELPPGDVTVVAEDVAWDQDRIEAPAGEEFTVIIDNRDEGIDHNLHITDAPGEPMTELEEGPVTQALTFTIDEPGEYEFVCDLHPNMDGVVVVQ